MFLASLVFYHQLCSKFQLKSIGRLFFLLLSLVSLSLREWVAYLLIRDCGIKNALCIGVLIWACAKIHRKSHQPKFNMSNISCRSKCYPFAACSLYVEGVCFWYSGIWYCYPQNKIVNIFVISQQSMVLAAISLLFVWVARSECTCFYALLCIPSKLEMISAGIVSLLFYDGFQLILHWEWECGVIPHTLPQKNAARGLSLNL